MKKKSLLLAIALVLSLSTNVSAANLDRLGGENRYETAALINNQIKSETLILVSGNDFADALSATSLVKYYNAEIHLVNKELDSNTINSVNNEFKKAIIVGGTSAVSSEIENELKLELGEKNVERLGGKNRYETSEIVAEKILELTNSNATSSAIGKAFVVTGKNFADALSVAPISASYGYPIILTPGESIGDLGLKTLNTIGSYYKIGGESVVSDKIDKLTDVESSSINRLSGANRYETNKAVIGEFATYAFNYNTTYVANGLNFPDALAGSVLAAKNKAPIVFVSNTATISAKDVITCFQSDNIIALGGTSVVSNYTMNSLIDTNIDKEVVFKYNNKVVLPEKGSEPTPENIDLVALGKKGNDCSWTYTIHKGVAPEASDDGIGFISFSVIIDGQYHNGRVEYTRK